MSAEAVGPLTALASILSGEPAISGARMEVAVGVAGSDAFGLQTTPGSTTPGGARRISRQPDAR